MSKKKKNTNKKQTVIFEKDFVDSDQDFTAKKLEIAEQDIYIGETKTKHFPTWIVPILLVIVITLVLVFVVPSVLSKIIKKQAAKNAVKIEEPDQFVLNADAVFNNKSVSVLAEPDLRAIRLYSGIYNEPVKVLNREIENGFYKIQMQDGSEGYVLANSLTFDLQSLNSETIKNKVLLINREKSIASDTTSGNIIATAPMGCILYADYVTETVVRVILPGGDIGWMSRENLLVIQANEAIPQPESKRADLFCSSALMFINVAYVPGGLDMDGIDIPGIIYLSGKTNGLDIPRQMEQQSKQGTQITFERDDKEGLANTDAFKPGDLLFFSIEQKPESLSSSAIYLADGNILYANGNQSYVEVVSFLNNEHLAKNLVTVRRLFE